MQAKKRYLLLFVTCAFLGYCYFGGYRLKIKKTSDKRQQPHEQLPSFMSITEEFYEKDLRTSNRNNIVKQPRRECRMETCFDFTRCKQGFTVYVYPLEDTISPLYQKILNVITESRYYTTDPTRACIFVLALDTLDRDPLSTEFVHNLPAKLSRLLHWNNGQNHLIFNLYSGTWPDYDEESLAFDLGYAMLAKASMSISRLRPNFDVSIPLFGKQHPERGGEPGQAQENNFPSNKKYVAAFKGKRYVHGIGSETRNALYHLHNGKDLVFVTTCRHGKAWRELQDEHCTQDNQEYDTYDYEILLMNSTFCLVPRGRRLGSFRFLEALRAGCIPVILSNGWALPFHEKIDWPQAVIFTDERLLLQIPDINVRERLSWEGARDGLVWNRSPGALAILPQFSDSQQELPFTTKEPGNAFTAIIYSQLGSTAVLYRLLRSLAKSKYLDKIILMWNSDLPLPRRSRWQGIKATIHVVAVTGISQRFYPHPLIKTSAILSLDEDATLNTDEIDFAFVVWQSFPERIVGYPARSHYWDDSKRSWGYTSKWTNDYSIVLTGAAFYHRYYNTLYTELLSSTLHKTVEQSQNCEDILMNFLVSHVTRRPPIKVTQRKLYKETSGTGIRSPWNDPDHFIQRQTCMNTFVAVFGYMPLLRSNMRLDPVLFKDSVSNLRKKYRQIELMDGVASTNDNDVYPIVPMVVSNTRIIECEASSPILSNYDSSMIASCRTLPKSQRTRADKMLLTSSVLLVLAVASGIECVRNTPRSARASRNEGSLEFECPEEFGYYPHPRDCTQYYVCVFGGALLESCTGGLMYSHELQTCDWPRNVGCLNGGSIAKETEEDDPLLERAAKAESVHLQQQPQHHQSRHQQRQPIQRQHHQTALTSSSTPVSQITERQQSRHRQQQQPQHQQRTYQDDEYEPATEIENDRQQRVYRGQPSTIGQVQRDRDGLRRNIISVSHPTSSSSSSSLLSSSSSSSSTSTTSVDVSVTPSRQDTFPNDNIVNQAASRLDRFDKRIQASSIDVDSSPIHRQLDYSADKRASEFDEGLEDGALTDNVSASLTSTTTTTILQQRVKDDAEKFAIESPVNQQRSTYGPGDSKINRESIVTVSSRSSLQQPRSRANEPPLNSPTSIANQWQRSTEEFEKNEISVTTPLTRHRTTGSLFSDISQESNDREEPQPDGFTSRNVNQQQRSRNDVFQSSSPSSWLRSTEELEKNEISVSPGPAGRGFMIKRLRSDRQDLTSDEKDISSVTVAYTSPIGDDEESMKRHEREESRNLEISIDPPFNRQRTRNTAIPSPFQIGTTETSVTIVDNGVTPINTPSARKVAFDNPEKRKYYLVTVPQRYSDENSEISEDTIQRHLTDDTRARKLPVNPIQMNSTRDNPDEKKYYIPSVQQQRAAYLSEESARKSGQSGQQRYEVSDQKADEKLAISKPRLDSSSITTTEIPTENKRLVVDDLPKSSLNMEKRRISVKATTISSSSSSSSSHEDPAKNEVSIGSQSAGQRKSSFSASIDTNDTEGNEIPNTNVPSIVSRGRQRSYVRGQSRHKTQEGIRRSSRPEREKDSVVNSRGQTESHYRTISSESPRIAKTTASTVATISKSYYSDPDQSYPYYTIYDDDVSIYKDDDYAQYTVNRTIQIPQQQQQPHHHQHQHQNVRIAEVTPNSNQYSQKPKKVTVNDADKYNLNPEVTVSDYDIYDSEPLKNKFRISDGQQSLRTNGLSHPVVHVTTPNAIVDTYVPLTTTTQQPPTTTVRPYTVTVQNRGRPQVNRGTAPPRLRPTLKPSTAIVSKAQEYVDIYRYPPVRPGPIYPTPTVDKPAAKCRKDVCLLPDCNCGGTDIPGDYLPEEIPQIVLLTFDDSVNDLNKGLYADLFEKGRKNPNGCPISATFYVSHEWTDYSQVQNLYANGHEIASHTVSHSFGEQFSARKWSREVAGQREILAAYGGVKLEDVRGMRAPFLSVGGNNMFKMLWDTNFTYDSSMPIYENRPPSWPYTLDYKLFHDCMIPPCPTRSYPGLWEVPMVMWQDLNGGRCSMGDACSNPPTPDGVYKMLIKNFERHYTTNRAPFGLFYHAAWFTQPHHKEGFISFLDTIVAMDDVWVVTNWQALQWVRNPTPLEALDRFEPFGCNYPDRPKRCNNAKVCNLWHKSGVRYMKTCQPCPDIYPWTGKTGIRSSRIDNEVEN